MARINLTQMLGMSSLLSGEDVEGDYSANVAPPSRVPIGGRVTTDQAITLPAAYRAVDIIAGMGWMLSLEAVRGRTVVNPTPSLIEKPDPWREVEEFLERTLVSLATDGNFYWLMTFVNGTVSSLEVLDPNHVHPYWEKGVKFYRIWTRQLGHVTKTSAEIKHGKYLEVPGHDKGLGPIQACRAAFAGIIDLRQYADGWFGDHASDVPSGVLTSDQFLDPEEAREYKSQWLNPTDADGKPQLDNGPTVRVLGKGLSYEPIMLKPEDAQWLEAQSFGVLDIARMWGMPAAYLLAALEGSSLTYTTLLMVDTQFMRNTMMPRYLRKIEVALSSCLPRGQKARFRISDFLKPDIKTQADVDKVYLDADVISPQEIRDRDGLEGPAPERRPAAQKTPTEAPA